MTDQLSRPSEAPARMLHMLNAFLTVQGLHVVATLGIADHLAHGARAVDDLANATGAHPGSLYRLLRMLVGVGVFYEEADGRFALTTLGETLRHDRPDSVRDWALYVGAADPWAAWGRLHETIMTGEAGFVLAHGMTTYELLKQHPELAAPFDRWMTHQSDQHNTAVVEAYDFSPHKIVVDLGGGQGSTLAAILRANPELRGILLDQPRVVADTAPLQEAGVADRCQVVGADLLRGVPGGADVYLIKRVLMVWGDEPSIQLLRHCAEGMTDDGKVLVVEMVMPAGNDPSPARSFDVLMLLANKGGRVRTEAEFRALFAAAGLRLARTIPTASPNTILEGVRA